MALSLYSLKGYAVARATSAEQVGACAIEEEHKASRNGGSVRLTGL
jgi:hypothetical protein